MRYDVWDIFLGQNVESARSYVKEILDENACVVNMKMRYLNFYFENPCVGGICERAGRLVTSKADKSSHGFGMENIKDIARKYDGFTSYGVESGVFWLRCSLNMCGRESA